MPIEGNTDDELVLDFQRTGSGPAIEELIRRHEGALLRFCRAQVGSANAEDLCQRVLIEVLRRPFDPRRGTFRAWLFGMAFKMSRNLIRSRHAQRRREENAQMRQVERLELRAGLTELEREECRTIALREFSALPPPLRMALDLSVIQGFSCEEIGKAMGVSRASANRLVAKAKDLMGRRLVKAGIFSPSLATGLELLRTAYLSEECSSPLFTQSLVQKLTTMQAQGLAAASQSIKATLALWPFKAVAGAVFCGGIFWLVQAFWPSQLPHKDTSVRETFSLVFPLVWDFNRADELTGLTFEKGDDWRWSPNAGKPDSGKQPGDGGALIFGSNVYMVFAPKVKTYPLVIEADVFISDKNWNVGAGWFSGGDAGAQPQKIHSFPHQPEFNRWHRMAHYIFEDSNIAMVDEVVVVQNLFRPPKDVRLYLTARQCVIDNLVVRETTFEEIPEAVRRRYAKGFEGFHWDFREPPPTEGPQALKVRIGDWQHRTKNDAFGKGLMECRSPMAVELPNAFSPPLIVELTCQAAGNSPRFFCWWGEMSAAHPPSFLLYIADQSFPLKTSGTIRVFCEAERQVWMTEREKITSISQIKRRAGDEPPTLGLGDILLYDLRLRPAKAAEMRRLEELIAEQAASLEYPLELDFNLGANGLRRISGNVSFAQCGKSNTGRNTGYDGGLAVFGKAEIHLTPQVVRLPMIVELDVKRLSSEPAMVTGFPYFVLATDGNSPQAEPDGGVSAGSGGGLNGGQWQRFAAYYFDDAIVNTLDDIPFDVQNFSAKKKYFLGLRFRNCAADNLKARQLEREAVPKQVRDMPPVKK